jgi:hypothetical protein
MITHAIALETRRERFSSDLINRSMIGLAVNHRRLINTRRPVRCQMQFGGWEKVSSLVAKTSG